MSRVVAYKEPSWFHPNADRQMWRHLTRAYVVDLELVDEEPLLMADETIVVVDEQGSIGLDGFTHPDDCTYVFGKTHQNDLINMPHNYSVRIDYPGEPCLFGVQAAAIVLADRERKRDSHD